MFKHILVPISSEFYSKTVIHRSIFLAETFQSTVHIMYILEDNPIQQMEKLIDTHLTHYNRNETHQELIEKQQSTLETIIRDEVQPLFKKKSIPMKYTFTQGELSNSLQKELENSSYDLIIIGYEKQCMIDYRFIDEITTPIWIEGGGYNQSILAVCSNLAPNQKVPEVSKILSDIFDWKLSMLYIIDTQDNVEVDVNGKRSIKKPIRDLESAGKHFTQEMKEQQINVKTVQGSIEQQTIKEANKMEAGLVIMGREQKQKGMLGFPVKNTKQKITERCKYSLLFLN